MEQRNETTAAGVGVTRKALRGSWTVTQKRQIVAESEAAGANVADVAQRRGVRPALLSSWRRQVSRMAQAAKKPVNFAAVRVNVAPSDGVIEIDRAEGCVRIRGIVDAQMLREVLAATR